MKLRTVVHLFTKELVLMNTQVNMRKCWQVTFSTYHPRGKCNTLNTLSSVYRFSILLCVHYLRWFLQREICIIFESFLTLQPFPLFLWPWCLIQGWYCCEKLDACHPQTLKGYLFILSGETWIPLGGVIHCTHVQVLPLHIKGGNS